MEQEKLKEIIHLSVQELKSNHFFLLEKANDVTEKSVSTKLASIIEKYFGETYDVDVEWNRMEDKHGKYVPKRLDVPNNNLVQPDIIVHKRGNNDDNLLIIEVKMTWKSKGKDFDLIKIPAYLDILHYKHGLYLELGESGIVEETWF
jgi:hypothetical protein